MIISIPDSETAHHIITAAFNARSTHNSEEFIDKYGVDKGIEICALLALDRINSDAFIARVFANHMISSLHECMDIYGEDDPKSERYKLEIAKYNDALREHTLNQEQMEAACRYLGIKTIRPYPAPESTPN